ncbi:MAG: outer membrane protein assembly factor BamA [Nitrospirae bacterium]|nr:outer membrane protein assembly factor BamA [Nitrospirota bacterium]
MTKIALSLLLSVSALLLSAKNLLAETQTPIRQIEVEGIYSIEKEEIVYLLDLKEGEVIDPERLERGIKRAFLKGIFEDILIELSSEGVLRVKVKERDFIEGIKVRGNSYLKDKFIKKHFLLKEEMPMRYDMVEEAQKRLKALYAFSGFPNVEVLLEIKRAKPNSINLVLSIKEGTPIRIKKIVISDMPKNEKEQKKMRSLMELKEGDVYDQFKLKTDIEALSLRLRKSGYLDPVVEYSFEDTTLHLTILRGKRLMVNIQGNEKVKARAIQAVLPFFETGDFRDELVEEAVSKTLSLYHENGYPFAKVAPVISRYDDEISLNLFIFEGRKVKVGSIRFEAVSIAKERLKEIMTLKEKGLFNPNALETDIAVIKEFYMALGYLNVEVAEPEVDIRDSSASINIKITEGSRVTVSSVRLMGVKHFSEAELEDVIPISEGDPYNEIDIADARLRIIDLYGKEGFVDAKVEIQRNIVENTAEVVFSIEEGSKVFIGKTIIQGNRRSKTVVIRRELDYSEGMPLNFSQFGTSRQRLYRLGIFTDAKIEVQDRYGDKADIAIKVQEGKAGAVEFGLGYGEYERYRGFVDISYRNLFGMNRQVSLRAELSTLESRHILNYYEPWFLGRRIPLRALFLTEQKKEKNIDTGQTRYRIKRHAVSVGTEKRIGRWAKADIFYEFSIAKTFDVLPDVILTKEDTGTLSISSIMPGVVYDTRDNAFDPRRGMFAGVSLKIASSEFLFSETDFVKLIVHVSTYKRLTKWLVSAVSLKGGTAKGFGRTKELPLIERFFLGGRSTVRGYAQDDLGPKSTVGTPTGGSAFTLGNLELRAYVGRGWSFVGFLDAGNVWPELDDVQLDKLKYTTGIGLRYITPVGPLRLDYGYKIDREPGESTSEIHFSIGHTF